MAKYVNLNDNELEKIVGGASESETPGAFNLTKDEVKRLRNNGNLDLNQIYVRSDGVGLFIVTDPNTNQKATLEEIESILSQNH